MVLKWIFFALLFVRLRSGSCCGIPECAYEACERITCPENLVKTCCPQSNRFVEVVKSCASKGGSSTLSTCSEATCVTEAYGILTNGQVDLDKVEQTIQSLDELDPSTTYLNSLVREYCVKKNYTCFPSEDPYCLPWRFANCAFYSYQVGCAITSSEGDCAYFANDVNTCKPFRNQYVQELNDNCYY